MTEVAIPAGFFVLKNPEGLWVDLDKSSGGYPYLVESVFRAHRWNTKREAVDYSRQFHDRKYNVVRIISVKGEVLD